MQRISLKDVAAQVGVHVSTVSRALSNSPRIPLATRTRIQQVAERMGYRPDPALAALNAYRQVRRAPAFQSTLAVITDKPDLQDYHTSRDQFAGMSDQAGRLGYQLDVFRLHSNGLNEHRLASVLTSRNIRGLLFTLMREPHTKISLPWERFSCVASGFSLETPALHRVASHHYGNALRALSHARELGYRRIGLAMMHESFERTARLFGAAYDTLCRNDPEMEPVPFCLLEGRSLPSTIRELRKWVERERIDAVFSPHDRTTHFIRWALQRKIPEEVGLILMGCTSGDDTRSGIQENDEWIGREMVNRLVAMIQRDERGLPDAPSLTLVEGRWIAGTTLRRAGSMRSANALHQTSVESRRHSVSAVSERADERP